MFTHLLKGVLSVIAIDVLENYRHLSIQLFRIEAAKSYLRGVQMARLSAIGLMQMGLVIGLVCIGAVLFHVGLFILLPWTVGAKALFGMLLGLAYVILGGVGLHVAMDERRWMEKSGAAEMLKDATARSRRE